MTTDRDHTNINTMNTDRDHTNINTMNTDRDHININTMTTDRDHTNIDTMNTDRDHTNINTMNTDRDHTNINTMTLRGANGPQFRLALIPDVFKEVAYMTLRMNCSKKSAVVYLTESNIIGTSRSSSDLILCLVCV